MVKQAKEDQAFRQSVCVELLHLVTVLVVELAQSMVRSELDKWPLGVNNLHDKAFLMCAPYLTIQFDAHAVHGLPAPLDD
jgi:hypothetical protein